LAGDIPQETNVSVLAAIFWALHSEIYKLAIYESANVDFMVAAFAQQLEIVMKGVQSLR